MAEGGKRRQEFVWEEGGTGESRTKREGEVLSRGEKKFAKEQKEKK